MRPLAYDQMVRRYRQGHGRGELSSYRPWLEVHDVPSWGICSRIFGQKAGRQRHLLSRGEKAFIVRQWDDDVVDLREQFPLWPIDETIAIAEDTGVARRRHERLSSGRVQRLQVPDEV
jgi:hypothetical protein